MRRLTRAEKRVVLGGPGLMRIDGCCLGEAVRSWTCLVSIPSVTDEFIDYSLSASLLRCLSAEGLKVPPSSRRRGETCCQHSSSALVQLMRGYMRSLAPFTQCGSLVLCSTSPHKHKNEWKYNLDKKAQCNFLVILGIHP